MGHKQNSILKKLKENSYDEPVTEIKAKFFKLIKPYLYYFFLLNF